MPTPREADGSIRYPYEEIPAAMSDSNTEVVDIYDAVNHHLTLEASDYMAYPSRVIMRSKALDRWHGPYESGPDDLRLLGYDWLQLFPLPLGRLRDHIRPVEFEITKTCPGCQQAFTYTIVADRYGQPSQKGAGLNRIYCNLGTCRKFHEAARSALGAHAERSLPYDTAEPREAQLDRIVGAVKALKPLLGTEKATKADVEALRERVDRLEGDHERLAADHAEAIRRIEDLEDASARHEEELANVRRYLVDGMADPVATAILAVAGPTAGWSGPLADLQDVARCHGDRHADRQSFVAALDEAGPTVADLGLAVDVTGDYATIRRSRDSAVAAGAGR